MKSTGAGLTIVCVGVVLISLSIPSIGDARIDPGSVVGAWLFDEGEDEVAKDSSNNGHDGEIRGNVKWVEGRFGDALLFPGIGGSRMNVPYEESLSLVTWSITMWMNLEDIGAWQYIFTKESQGDLRNYIVVSDNNGILYVAISGKVWAGEQITSRTKVYDEHWHHVAATYDKKTMFLYVDGIVEGQMSLGTTPIENETDVVLGERFDGSASVKGMIDELGLFNRALTEDEIESLMDDGLDKGLGLTAVYSEGKLATAWGEIKGTE